MRIAIVLIGLVIILLIQILIVYRRESKYKKRKIEVIDQILSKKDNDP